MTSLLTESALEGQLEAASYELESEVSAGSLAAESERYSAQPEGFWPAVLRVAAVGARGAAPLFRVIGRRLAPAGARAAARRLPGVFVRGTSRQVRTFARKVGGTLIGPERHGTGLPHYHLIRNGDRIHVWYGRRIPGGEFFE
jgi:hypothetical protein